STLVYDWSATEDGVAFTDNGTHEGQDSVVTFSGPGTYHLHLTVRDPEKFIQTTYDVTDITLTAAATSLQVSPSRPVVSTGSFVTLTATQVDQFGKAVTPQPTTFSWTIDGPGSLVDPATGNAPTGSTAKYVPSGSGTTEGIVATVHVAVAGAPTIDI